MSLNEISKASKSVITAAQSGTINPDLLKGATFTVSNLGSLGIESFTPIVNPPQTGILGIDCVTKRIKEVNGEDVVYPAMGLSLTVDHRVLDGADAARAVNFNGGVIAKTWDLDSVFLSRAEEVFTFLARAFFSV